ncbi:prion-inhibition and propagation-domain-containing protein [Schizothecium vesticola]|uniref:Prion-inhibition and propagation-domain-containing protein n=1 Tax=Schizothecium vesticola TaxID=314040 RepID=A0AA40EPP3_9PEZI|nr:prion-inhibition and propagation-domain-containing protein [Schizothecium vesticola]
MAGLEVLGAVSGLAGLFSTAITWFDYVLVAKQAAPRLQSLLVKLDNAHLRLTRWGKAAGLTGPRIEDEESLRSSESFQLNEQQEQQAIRTFRAVADLFEECQKLCHRERNGKTEDDPSVRETEISPFGTVGPNWNPMHRYLHRKMRDITDGRSNKVSVTQRVKFAIYKKEHLEDFIKHINDHIDELYKIYEPPAEKETELGKAELEELLEVVRALAIASDRDPNNDTTYNIKGGTSMNVGTHQGDPRDNDPQACRVIPLPQNEDIVDRTHIFTRLDALLPSPSEYQSAALCGLGGSGKTQVALEYAYRRCRDDPTCSVFWVHADNETTFAQDYTAIARRLGLDKLDGEKLLVAVCERIESTPSWLLVLDNADDLLLFGVGRTPHHTSHEQAEESTSLYKYVPKGGTGTVLWTSRDERIVGTLVSPRRGIQVGQMDPKEASTLLERSRNEKVGSDEVVDAEKLLEELQWLPLAISQAGAYLRRTSTPIGEYLSKLAEGKQRWRILKATEFDRHRRDNVPNSILETWSISIERIRRDNEMAYRILHIIAYVNNQDIPFEIMTAAGLFGDEGEKGDPEEDKDRVVEAVTRLKEFSFLGMRTEGRKTRSYEMHKLVQEATRYGLRVGDSEDEAYFSSAALQIMAKLFPKRKRENWAECEKYIAHAVQVGEWAETCKREVEVSNLLTRVSDYLFDRGRWREKEPVDKRAYKLRRGVLGESHPDTIRSMALLAGTYYTQGRHGEAEPIMIKVLELRRQVLGETHPDTIWSMANLATTYHAQGRYGEAEPIDIKVLELRRQVLGETHPDTIWSTGELAVTYHTQGRYGEAESIKIKVLELRRQLLGETHPDTIQSMGGLAVTYHAQGRYGEAEPIKIKVLELRRQLLGETHPDTIWSMGELAVTYHAQGRYGEAEPIKIKVLELRRQLLGETHPDTIWSMASLAATYYMQGRHSEAEPIKIKVLELRRQLLGETHPDTMRSMASLAATYYMQGRHSEAEPIKIKVLELRRQALGETHPHSLQAMHDLAITWKNRVLGLDHPFTRSSERTLGSWKTE